MSMTKVGPDEEAAAAPPATKPDERISHRGPMRRWLISPEIGALIGAVVVWTFLWGNGETFGTAGTTLNWLDVAAPYGIMATAVALLMIGGEFDLSSGVQTGGAAMVIGRGSASFEILRHLVDRLPAMIAPRWVETRTQPVAIADAVRALWDELP